MSLPASQQRVLDRIEDTLKRREPRLASMFAIFTRLTSNEALPRRESLHPAPWWSPHRWAAPGRHGYGPVPRVRAVVLLALAAVLVVAAVFVGMSGSRVGCGGPSTARGPLVQAAHMQYCPAVPQAKGSGHGP